MKSEDLLSHLIETVGYGKLTTYGDLSTWAYGNSNRGPAIVSMLNGIVAREASNSIYTNRVVGKTGKVVDVNSQHAQLSSEGHSIQDDRIFLTSDIAVRF
jgi:alkylated DNA nucleotide flippase Atl1